MLLPRKLLNIPKIIEKSFSETIEFLTLKYGQNNAKWAWGNVHQLILEHPMGSVKILAKIFKLNKGPFSVGGTYHTVCPYSFELATWLR